MIYNLFTYGVLRPSNKTDVVNKMRPYIKKTIYAKLYGYDLIVNKNGFLPSIVKSKNKNDYVVGELVICDTYENYEKILDMTDLLSKNFERYKVDVNVNGDVETNNGPIIAETYIILDDTNYIKCGYPDYYQYLKYEKNLLVG